MGINLEPRILGPNHAQAFSHLLFWPWLRTYAWWDAQCREENTLLIACITIFCVNIKLNIFAQATELKFLATHFLHPRLPFSLSHQSFKISSPLHVSEHNLAVEPSQIKPSTLKQTKPYTLSSLGARWMGSQKGLPPFPHVSSNPNLP